MKVLHILDHSLPLHSGYTFRSQNIFKAQQRMGFNTVVLTSAKHEASWKKQCLPMEIIDGINYYRSGPIPDKRLPGVGEIQIMRQLYKRIHEICLRENPDILYAHSPVLNALPALAVGRALNLPVFYEIRAFWEDAAVDHGTYGEWSWKYRVTRLLETFVCNKVTHVTTICEGLKKDLVNRGIPASKITIIYNAIHPDDFKYVPPDEAFIKQHHLAGKVVIGFIGSFYRYEGLDLLVRSLPRVLEKIGNAVLLLVGGGEMEDELRIIASDLGIESRVIIPGRIPHDRVQGVYSIMDVLAYPRYKMRLTDLVTPLKPLEAMAMGKALVASDVGGHKELVFDGETGILFSASDHGELSSRLIQVLSDKGLKQKLEKAGPSWVRKHHTWDITTSPYRRVLEPFMREEKNRKMNSCAV